MIISLGLARVPSHCNRYVLVSGCKLLELLLIKMLIFSPWTRTTTALSGDITICTAFSQSPSETATSFYNNLNEAIYVFGFQNNYQALSQSTYGPLPVLVNVPDHRLGTSYFMYILDSNERILPVLVDYLMQFSSYLDFCSKFFTFTIYL